MEYTKINIELSNIEIETIEMCIDEAIQKHLLFEEDEKIAKIIKEKITKIME